MDKTLKLWIGRVECDLARDNPKRKSGFIGALFNFVCLADDAATCVRLLQDEGVENGLIVAGFEFLYDKAHLDREPSEYELGLIDKLEQYPVQFHNVHFFKLNG